MSNRMKKMISAALSFLLCFANQSALVIAEEELPADNEQPAAAETVEVPDEAETEEPVIETEDPETIETPETEIVPEEEELVQEVSDDSEEPVSEPVPEDTAEPEKTDAEPVTEPEITEEDEQTEQAEVLQEESTALNPVSADAAGSVSISLRKLMNGFKSSMIVYDTENPDKVRIEEMQVFDSSGNQISCDEDYYYDTDYKEYPCIKVCNDRAGTITVRAKLRTDDGTEKYSNSIQCTIEQVPFSASYLSEETFSQVTEINVVLKFSQFSKADVSLTGKLYFRKKGNTDYIEYTGYFNGAAGSFRMSPYSLDPDSEYEYYYQITYKDIENTEQILYSKYSADAPASIRTASDRTLTASDFEDGNLYQVLFEKYSGYDQMLTLKDLDDEYDFDLSYGKTGKIITSLEGIENIQSIIELDISNQNISDLTPVTKLKKLGNLDASGNDIRTLPDLSDTKLTYLNLNNNLLSESSLDVRKLPSSYQDDSSWLEFTLEEQRPEEFVLEDIYYLYDGEAEFAFGAYVKEDDRQYTVDVTVNGKTKTASSSEKSYKKETFKFDDLNEGTDGFGIEEGSVNAVVTLKDELGTVLSKQTVLHFGNFDPYMDPVEISSFTTFNNLEISFGGEWNMEDVSVELIREDGLVPTLRTDTYVDTYFYSETRYPKMYDKHFSFTTKHAFSELTVQIYSQVPAGVYDVKVTLKDKGTYILEDKLISDGEEAGTLLTYTSLSSDYDNSEYIHVETGFTNVFTDEIIPVLYSEDGVQLTEKEPVNIIIDYWKSGTGNIIYVLKKTASFPSGVNSIEGTIRLYNPSQVLMKDMRESDDFYLPLNQIEILEAYYNYKKEAVEVVFTSNVPAGTEVFAQLQEEYGSVTIAETSGVTDSDHRAVLHFTDGQSVLPYENSYDNYIQCDLTINGKQTTLQDYIRINKYNYYNAPAPYVSAPSVLFAPVKSFRMNLTAYDKTFNKSDHVIDMINESTGAAVNASAVWTEETAQSENVNYLITMNFSQDLTSGNYSLRLKDKTGNIKFRTTIKIIDDDGRFYQHAQNVYKVENTLCVNIFSATLGKASTDAELKKLWQQDGYELHLYDGEKQELTGWEISSYSVSHAMDRSAALYISGLDPDLPAVYSKVSRNGQYGIYPGTETAYYETAGGTTEYGMLTSFTPAAPSNISLIGDYYNDHFYYAVFMGNRTDIYPVTISFYRRNNSAPAKRITINDLSDCNNGYSYYFTEEDLSGISSDDIYHIEIVTNSDYILTNDGYLGVKSFTPPQTIKVTGIKISDSNVALTVNDEKTLSYTITPADATNRAVTWTSSDESVAIVSDGTVTAVGAGTAVITVTTADGNKTATCTVTVAEPVKPEVTDIYIYRNGLRTTVKGDTELEKNTDIFFETTTGNSLVYQMNGGEFMEGSSCTYEGGEVTLTVKAVNAEDESAEYTVHITEKDTSWNNEPGDVIPEDAETAGEEIPEDLWVTDVTEEVTYTGKAIKITGFRVYHYKTLLKEKTDYTVSYVNNVNAGEAQIMIKGKGNYSGSAVIPFTIKPVDLSETTVSNIQLKNTGSEQEIKPVVKWGKKTLKKGTDYTVSPITDNDFWTTGGEETVTITGTGNYTGTKDITVYIPKAAEVLMSKASVTLSAKTVNYDDELPAVKVMYNKQPVDPSAYEVIYPETRQAGKATLIVKGTGVNDDPDQNVVFNGEKKLTYTVKGIALSKKTVTVTGNTSAVYTGRYQTSALGLEGLAEGTDYTVTQARGLKAGKYTAVFSGKGRYSGTYKVTWTITASSTITVAAIKDQPYAAGGVTPEVTVTDGTGTKLVKGTDYTVKYANNKKIGTATVTVTGKGNYKGAKGTQTFNITGQDIGLLNVASKDVNFVNKKNKYKSAPVVTDVNGKKVSAKEYTVTYSYENGLPVGTNDIPKSGTVIRVTVTGKGTNYTGSKTTEYRVIDKTNNISDTKAYKAAVQGIFVYTGSPIHPGTEVIDLTDKVGNRLHDFEIVSYGTNIKKGTGTVVIRGTGELGGTRTVKFTILVQPITDIENISK